MVELLHIFHLLSHAARADGGENFVRTEFCAC